MGSKPWYLSRGVIGGVIGVLASVAQIAGHGIDAHTQSVLSDNVVTIIGAGGSMIAIYGRIKATKTITATAAK